MRVLWRVYDFTCANETCKEWQYECRVPGDHCVDDYRPDYCRKCGGIQISQRQKGETVV